MQGELVSICSGVITICDGAEKSKSGASAGAKAVRRSPWRWTKVKGKVYRDIETK